MRRWLFIVTIFLSLPFFSYGIGFNGLPLLLQRSIQREIYSDNFLETNHFNIFWGDDFPLNDIWLNKQNNLPIFINELSSVLEDSYDMYLENNLTLPHKINVYLLNTDLNASDPPLMLDNISSLGAFTSDDLPEILINAKIGNINADGVSFTDRLKSVVLHELMHAHQYVLGLIKKEDKKNKNLWLIEGLAVAFQLYYSNDQYLKEVFVKYLSANINKGFLYDDYYLSYTAGLFFEYLVKQGYITSEKFYQNVSFDKKKYFGNLSKIIGKDIYSLFYEFYKYLNVGENGHDKRVEFGGAYVIENNSTYFIKGFKPKNMSTGNYLVGEGEIKEIQVKNFDLQINNGWNIYISPFGINESTLEKIDGIIWKYDGDWSCRGDEKINLLCKKYYGLITNIQPNEGFWIYSNSNYDIEIKPNFLQDELFYKPGWNLSGNPLNKSIYFNNSYLIWKYNQKWECSYINDIEIIPNEGFWIYRLR